MRREAGEFPEQGRIYRHGILQSTGASLRDALGAIARRCQLVDDPTQVTPAADALLVGSAGLARHPLMARVHIYMGLVLVSGYNQRALGVDEFRSALRINPMASLPARFATHPAIAAAFREALPAE